MDSFIVYMRFLALCSLSEDDGEKYRFLCEDAINLLTSKAKDENVISSQSGSFCIAAAALAALNYASLYLQESSGSFSAGDVSIQLDGKLSEQRLREYYEECLQNIKSYLKDTDFIFEAV